MELTSPSGAGTSAFRVVGRGLEPSVGWVRLSRVGKLTIVCGFVQVSLDVLTGGTDAGLQ